MKKMKYKILPRGTLKKVKRFRKVTASHERKRKKEGKSKYHFYSAVFQILVFNLSMKQQFSSQQIIQDHHFY